MNTEKLWDRLIDEGIATNDELQLVTDLMGYSEDTMYAVLFSRTGYRNFEQMEDEQG